MPSLDRQILAERVSTVERHLARVAQRLPQRPEDLQPGTDASDAVILHLWQAVQVVIDLALALCVQRNLGTPSSYADAFEKLAAAGDLDRSLATRLAKAAGFRNLIAHAYEKVDMARVHESASAGPAELRTFLRRARDLVG
jgi:uncharacterized protein YutE (UPF0331/DUF86 family)